MNQYIVRHCILWFCQFQILFRNMKFNRKNWVPTAYTLSKRTRLVYKIFTDKLHTTDFQHLQWIPSYLIQWYYHFCHVSKVPCKSLHYPLCFNFWKQKKNIRRYIWKVRTPNDYHYKQHAYCKVCVYRSIVVEKWVSVTP